MITFLVALIVSYIWNITGVTIGYHRLLAHRSFKCPKFVEYFFVAGGYFAYESSPIWWATIHRAHHRYTDEILDPHSPRHGWKHAYFGWFFDEEYPAHIDPAVQAKDLINDPIYQFLEQGGNWHRMHWLSFSLGAAFRLVLWFVFGWEVALASLIAGLAVQQIPLLLNVACHIPRLGYQNFATGEDSINVWWVAMLTAGEGWHNNHHAFPGSARSGLKPHEIDPSWLIIRFLKSIGLVKWMNEASINSIYKLGKPRTISVVIDEPEAVSLGSRR